LDRIWRGIGSVIEKELAMVVGKAYAVFLTEGAAEELGKAFSIFIKTKDHDSYIYAKSIDPEGNYYHMTVDQEVLAGGKIELEIQIHHEYVKGAFCGTETEIKELGFL
jgi:hypothetical protein